MVNRYSLTDYIITIKANSAGTTDSQITQALFGSSDGFQLGGNVGGEGSFLGSIKIKRNSDIWSTEGDPTGSWVHSLTLNKTGEVAIELRQVSDVVEKFATICQVYLTLQGKNCGLNITVSGASSGKAVAECVDCYIKAVPSQDFAEAAGMQSWEFTCGKVDFYQ